MHCKEITEKNKESPLLSLISYKTKLHGIILPTIRKHESIIEFLTQSEKEWKQFEFFERKMKRNLFKQQKNYQRVNTKNRKLSKSKMRVKAMT